MSRKPLKTLIEEAERAGNTKALRLLQKEEKRRRNAKNKSRRKSYRKKVRQAKKQQEKEARRFLNKQPRVGRKGIYHIILTNNGKRLEDLYQTPDEIDVNTKFKELIDESLKIDFPVRFNSRSFGIVPSDYELVIIKQNDENNSVTTQLRDEMGDFVEYGTNNDKWIVYDRAEYFIEETFWVYGYNPIHQRKTYKWVYEYLASLKEIKGVKFILTLYNKVLLDFNGNFTLIICKNKSDSSRLYNTLLRDVTHNKLKGYTFMGKIEDSVHKSDWVNRISEVTGWNKKKIYRQATQTKTKKKKE